MDQLAEIIQYDQAMLMSVEERELRIEAARGLPDADHPLERSYDYTNLSLLRDLLASGDPLILPDVQQQANADELPGVLPQTKSWMAIPLLTWGIVTGLLTVGSNQVDSFDSETIRTATAFAQQAAIAIQNVRIVGQLSEMVDRLREAQARLSGAARLTAAGEIAAGVAHQLNNPLTAVIAEVSLMLEHLGPDDLDYESAMTIRAAAEQAAAIVQRQLNLSRSIPYEMVAIDINKSVAEALALVRSQIEPSAHLVTDLSPDLPLVMASPEHLSDVWLNLLLNARDSVAKKADAVIHVRTELAREGNAVKVAIQDNGEGIPQEHLEHIFDPFFSTRSGGYGLGLWVCYEVVRQHNGKIDVDSHEGVGTTMSVALPIPQNAHVLPQTRSGESDQ
jgi:signal transduction histidine kinase